MPAVLLDLEGTLFAKGAPLPGATDAVRALRELGCGLRFLTNIDSRSPAAVAEEVAGYGLEVRVAELFTPVSAARQLFAGLEGASVHTLVSTALREEFAHLPARGPVTHVLVGDCRDTLDYPALDAAFRALRAGAELVALQRGRYFRRDDGDHVDTGAVVAGLEYAAGVSAKVLGKPSTDFFALAARSLGLAVSDCVVVGDDATTDVAGGLAAGAATVQVRTGKFAAQREEGLTGRAHAEIDSIADLPALLGTPLR
ncbi:HAD hydrolase-like protein [Actinosynnema sp. NPDC020468]|uniref:HAD hydrolase-like protein n=1 Tax=Actinosynnema sp. NPDC020468 TaxID=3154488 RepID=UPI0033C1A80D